MVVDDGSVVSDSVPVPVPVPVPVSGRCGVDVPVLGSSAKSPELWMIDPSLRERIRVDCTPGRDVRCERSEVTCCGTCVCVCLLSIS